MIDWELLSEKVASLEVKEDEEEKEVRKEN